MRDWHRFFFFQDLVSKDFRPYKPLQLIGERSNLLKTFLCLVFSCSINRTLLFSSVFHSWRIRVTNMPFQFLRFSYPMFQRVSWYGLFSCLHILTNYTRLFIAKGCHCRHFKFNGILKLTLIVYSQLIRCHPNLDPMVLRYYSAMIDYSQNYCCTSTMK